MSGPDREATTRAIDRSHRRLDIQGLRAVAVLMVVAFHSGLPVPGGFVGVDVFFVISGFVIAGLLSREWHSTGAINFGRFYVRRFKRLTPALALMVTVTVAISAALLSPLGLQQTAAQTGVAAMLLFANVVIAQKTGGYFDADAHTNPLLHTWSLSVEEQFYLLFPALIALSWYLARRHRSVRFLPQVVVCALAVLSFAIACRGIDYLNSTPLRLLLNGKYSRWVEATLGFYSPVTRAWEFAIGVILAMAAGRLVTLSRTITFSLGVSGATLLAASLWLISGETPFPGVWTLVPVIGTLLLLAAGTGAGNAVTRALSVGSFTRVGDWSYSIYLWHWPLIVFAGLLWPGSRTATLLAAGLSVMPAVASYRWVELPIRSQQGFHGLRLAKAVGIALFVPLLVCSTVRFVADRGYWSPGIRAMQAAVLQQHPLSNACVAYNLDTESYLAECVFNADAAGKPLYLVGDSTAWHFSDAAIIAARRLGRPLNLIGVPLCEFKDIYADKPELSPRGNKLCREGYETAMHWLLRHEPGTVLISNINVIFEDDSIAVGRQPDALTTDPQRRIAALDAGLTATVKALQNAGHRVVLAQIAPNFKLPKVFDPLRCTINQLRSNDCVGRMSISEADTVERFQRLSLQEIAVQTRADIWDPRDFFCHSGICATQGYGLNLYRDQFHISADASRLLAPSLVEALADKPSGGP